MVSRYPQRGFLPEYGRECKPSLDESVGPQVAPANSLPGRTSGREMSKAFGAARTQSRRGTHGTHDELAGHSGGTVVGFSQLRKSNRATRLAKWLPRNKA